jgi:hypothetical protein
MIPRKTFEVVKYGLRAEEAGNALGAPALLDACVEAGWIAPAIHRHKLVVFDKGDVAKCWLRIRNGESPYPPTGTIPGGIRPRRKSGEAAAAAGG